MTLNLPKPILYLITRGATTEATTPDSEEFQNILRQVSAAVAAGIQLIQIREKQLTAQVLSELTTAAVALAQGSSTRILVNDRADIAAGAGAAGVHLTTRSLAPAVIRRSFGKKFVIGVSTHSPLEVHEACSGGADFAVCGPIFQTSSKEKYGPPLGTEKLIEAVRESGSFPVIALGGISLENAHECLRAGASGIAGITLFGEPNTLKMTVETINELAKTNLWGVAQ
jgi:thiamine-phosphate pyrophosphorylase